LFISKINIQMSNIDNYDFSPYNRRRDEIECELEESNELKKSLIKEGNWSSRLSNHKLLLIKKQSDQPIEFKRPHN
jgi:hypothetical protein